MQKNAEGAITLPPQVGAMQDWPANLTTVKLGESLKMIDGAGLLRDTAFDVAPCLQQTFLGRIGTWFANPSLHTRPHAISRCLSSLTMEAEG